MTRAEFIQKAYLKATGKPTAPTAGSKKYNQLVEYGKYYVDSWLNEPDIDWNSTYDYFNCGTVTATDTFAFDADLRKPSQQLGDYIHVDTADNEYYFTLIPAERLQENRYNNAVAVVGRNLKFSEAFKADSVYIGGDLIVPGYGFATFPDTDGGDIPVDDPNWLVTIVAAEFTRNDKTRANQYPNLVAEANVLMRKMKENNGGRIEEIYRPYFFASGDIY